MITLLSNENKSALEQGYYGAYLTIWANHVWNPIEKFNSFEKGTKELELTIAKNPNEIELRYLRLSIQSNAPKILKYNQNINSDLLFIRNNITKVKEKRLKDMIYELLNTIENSKK